MDINTRQLAEFVGVTAVVLSLIFVALELRQSNKIAIASSENEIRTAQRERSTAILESPEVWDLEVKIKNGEDLTPEETVAMTHFVRSNFLIWGTTMQQYNNDVLSEYTLNVQINNMKAFFRDYPGAWQYLGQMRDDFQLIRGINVMWDVLNDELDLRGI